MQLPDVQIKAFLDAAPDAMVIVDPGGCIAFTNRAAEATFGYTRSELAGLPLEVLLPERLRARHGAHLQSYYEAPRRRSMGGDLELRARRKDGTEFPVEISLSPVATNLGTFVSSAIRDVTDRKALEQKLLDARERAEQANRAKSAFLAAASHDLRQPLQTLTVLSSVLSRVVPAHSKAASAVVNQSQALRLMGDLVNSLLDISKLEAGVIRPDITDCSVRRIFQSLRSEFSALAEAKGLELIVDDCEAIVRSDPVLLGQIVQNLVANAIRYTREGWVRLRCLAAATTVTIEVLDTGVGIPADELGLVFDEYYRTSSSVSETNEGVGLGLSIARRMASLLGCSLDARSTVGAGSCFTVNVPRASAPAQLYDRPAWDAAQTPPQNSLVLVIDDDAAVADATGMLLGSAGIDVIVAHCVEDALEALSTRDGHPDLLVCDYHLRQGATGLAAIRAVREATRAHLPAIVVSGDTSGTIKEAVIETGGCYLVSKPVDGEALLGLCASLLRECPGDDD